MKRVAVIGTVGVPANYGGFESLVENLVGDQSSSLVDYTVFCSSKAYKTKLDKYKNANLKYIALNANGIQSIPYDIISLFNAIKYDVVLVLGVSGCCCLPIYRLLFPRKRLIINIDGLEHRRDKWGRWTRCFLKFSEKMAVKYADVIITDNKGIQNYVLEEYGKQSEMIAYGGDHSIAVQRDVHEQEQILHKYHLNKSEYAISVCRIEPENNCHITLEAFAQTGDPLVFIGNWDKSDYGVALKEKYSKVSNITILNPIYDIDILYALRSNAAMYIHGHSAGGTNPSLVEAMFFGIPIISYDVIYNRETTHNKAFYFKDVDELKRLLQNKSLDLIANADAMKQMAEKYYTWADIVRQYEAIY